MIESLNTLNYKDIKKFGCKACNLARIYQNKMSTPNGFVISNNINKNNISQFQDKILNNFDELNCEHVSVRSSTILEDCNKTSFAGLFDTYLNVSKKDLFEKIHACHNSLNSDKVKQYCNFKNIPLHKLKMAVIVQKMVIAKTAGITFTKDPVHNKEEMIIETSNCSCDSLVSGKINPTRYYINRTNKEVVKKDEKINSILSENDVNNLFNNSLKLETMFNSPQDIEWLIDNQNKFWILQSRPITTL
tara:strand:+ start:635 stop:1375 length:741 start_codon:yes stop_codon:yes gene_type:complete